MSSAWLPGRISASGRWAALLACLLLPASVAAQHRHAPYAGQQQREIKALSPTELDGLLQGEGLGLAKSAELNGLPGPKHVLELADQLALTDDQRSGVEAIHGEMRREAIRIGREVVRRERDLDRRFAHGTVTAAEVEEATAAIAELMGRLRAVHLKAHLATDEVLTDEQVRRYQHLRGYADGHEGER